MLGSLQRTFYASFSPSERMLESWNAGSLARIQPKVLSNGNRDGGNVRAVCTFCRLPFRSLLTMWTRARDAGDGNLELHDESCYRLTMAKRRREPCAYCPDGRSEKRVRAIGVRVSGSGQRGAHGGESGDTQMERKVMRSLAQAPITPRQSQDDYLRRVCSTRSCATLCQVAPIVSERKKLTHERGFCRKMTA